MGKEVGKDVFFANQSGTAGRTVSEEAVFIVQKSIRSILVAVCTDRRENKK